MAFGGMAEGNLVSRMVKNSPKTIRTSKNQYGENVRLGDLHCDGSRQKITHNMLDRVSVKSGKSCWRVEFVMYFVNSFVEPSRVKKSETEKRYK